MRSRTGEGVCTGCGAAVVVVADWVDAIIRVREGVPEVRVIGVPGRPIQYHASETMPLQSLKIDGFHFANSAMLKLPNMSVTSSHVSSKVVRYHRAQSDGYPEGMLPSVGFIV
jgi:hypothetical protein